MLECLISRAAELFKGGIFIIDKASVLACGDKYVYMIQNWAGSQSCNCTGSMLFCRHTDTINISPKRKNDLEESLTRYKGDAEKLQRRICELERGDARR
jgi:hypothetical protein